MFKFNSFFKTSVSVFLLLSFSLTGAAQKKEKKEAIKGTPVLWESVDVSRQNLLLGPGGNSMRPNLSRITFVKEEDGGSNTKYRIKDGSGRVWVAKLGQEAQSETAAVRLVWALGYKSEINYLVPELTIPTKGTFTNVRLEARPKNIKRLDEWKWKDNPFVGTDELQGLKVMMALLNNWDLKDDNNKIFFARDQKELEYVISDLGATFGKTGNIPLLWRIQRSRNQPVDYSEAKFINKVKDDGRISFDYGGKMRELFDDITVSQTVWISRLLSQLSEEQIRDAFRAANYSESEIEMLTESVMQRIQQLNSITAQNRIGSKGYEK